ncbi:MAG: PilZ domain-containing protein, partial [Polyangiaceae bacterium]|nr:PilZ domain-containing protein [Polyangiaceae bacterium]
MDERRASGNERIPFEALIAVEAEGEGRFECEAVDLSAGGLRARSAYLPALGRRLRCRFDVGGQERRAEARVVWRVDQTRGGEFGLAFDGLEPATRAAVESFCGIVPARRRKRPAERGDRVRLHIEGLGSPMRARVQDTETGKLMVASNLEFLRLGRPLSLEDVDQGKSLSAVIDRVDVQIDPASRIPQLLVRLRCDEPSPSAQAAVAAAGESARPPAVGCASALPPSVGRGAVVESVLPPLAAFSKAAAQSPSADHAPIVESALPPSVGRGPAGATVRPPPFAPVEPRRLQESEAPAAASRRPGVISDAAPRSGSAAELASLREDPPGEITTPIDELIEGTDRLASKAGAAAPAAERVDSTGKAAAVMAALRASAGRLGPRLGAVAAKARQASALARKRLGREETTTTTGKRTTTQMPTVTAGAERRGLGAGRDATMEEQQEAAGGIGAVIGNKSARRWLALGGAGIAAALLATMALRTRSDAPPGADATRPPEASALAAAPGSPLSAVQGSPLAGAPVANPAGVGDAVTANVPLFGATPLSTIEPVAVPPGAPVPSAFAGGLPPSVGGTLAAPSIARVDAGGSEGHGAATFGRGEVRRPRTVRLQMDAPVGALRGNVSDGSVVLTVVGRHNIEPAAALVRRDPRLASVKAVPVGDDTEVTLSFKDEVPPFLARASGRSLEIDLGSTRGTTASADSGEHHGKKRRGKRSHESSSSSSDRHGSRSSEHETKRDGGKDERRHADAGKNDKDDRRHADAKADKNEK